MTQEIAKLKEWIDDSDNIVFFGGAGVSTESGLPDFRSADGIYNKKYDFPYPPEKMLSYSFFLEHPADFFRFHRSLMVCTSAKPNAAHVKLAELEAKGKLKAVITQNIDNLHQAAGSKNVLELHGSCYRNFCMKCGKSYPIEYILDTDDVPLCECGGIVKPDVVLYEESLNQETIRKSIYAIQYCDMLIVGGTSLSVYPAAGMVNYYDGDRLVLINGSPTPYDSKANLLIKGKIGEVLSQI